METQLHIKGQYGKGRYGEKNYQVMLYDEVFEVDRLSYSVTGTKVNVPGAYKKTPEGARQQAKDYWF